jgi:hypothetical protein
MSKMYALAPTKEKSTRDCIDPWLFAQITSEREVKPCCVMSALDVFSEGVPLSAVLDGPKFRELRRELLTGELGDACTACPVRPLTDVSSLRRRVRAELRTAAAFKYPFE